MLENLKTGRVKALVGSNPTLSANPSPRPLTADRRPYRLMGAIEHSWSTGFSTLRQSDVSLTIGVATTDHPAVGSLPLERQVDDVYIYDRALSASAVQTLFSVVPEPSTALLLGLGLAG